MAELLNVGDLLVLDVDGDCYVSSEGMLDTDVSANVARSGERFDQFQSAFLLRPQQNYVAENRLRAELDAKGVSRALAQTLPEFRGLFEARESEKSINLGEFEHKMGTVVHYGMVVQLQHVLSEKYLQVTRQRGETRTGRRVTVSRDAGEMAWFVVQPSLRVHKEGEPVHLGDRVILESVSSGMALCVGEGGVSGTLHREVYGARLKDATPLQVRLGLTWLDLT
jgi:hypothetical protein